MKRDWYMKRARCRQPERVAIQARERPGTPPETHGPHRLAATGKKYWQGGRQMTESQIAKGQMRRAIPRVGPFPAGRRNVILVLHNPVNSLSRIAS